MQLTPNRTYMSQIRLALSAEPKIALMLKSPATANRQPRNVWLLFDDSVPDARLVKVVVSAKLPVKYKNLPTLPLIGIDVAEYNAWTNFAQSLSDHHPEPQVAPDAR